MSEPATSEEIESVRSAIEAARLAQLGLAVRLSQAIAALDRIEARQLGRKPRRIRATAVLTQRVHHAARADFVAGDTQASDQLLDDLTLTRRKENA